MRDSLLAVSLVAESMDNNIKSIFGKYPPQSVNETLEALETSCT